MISVPDPTTVLMVPAATPASRIATISSGRHWPRRRLPRGPGGGRSPAGRGSPARRAASAARAAAGDGGLLGRGDGLPAPRVGRSSSVASPRSAPARCCPCRPACAGRRRCCGMPCRLVHRRAEALERLADLAGHDPDLVGVALGDLRHHLEVLVGQQRLVGLAVVDGLEDRLDGLPLTLGPQDRGLPVGLGAQDLRLAVTLGVEDRGLLVALGGEDRGLPLALGGEDRRRACRGRRASASPSSP